MKRFLSLILPVAVCAAGALAQAATAPWKPDARLEQQLRQSGNVHRIMKADPAYAGLTRWEAKPVLASRPLPLAENFERLRHTGPGTISVDTAVTISGKGSVRLDTPAELEKKNPTNRNYATPEIIFPLDGEDLRDFNRFSVWVRVEAPGVYLTFGGFTLYNEGDHLTPTPGRFEGQHFETIYPYKWQHIVWEIPDLYRDKVTGLGVNIMLAGAPVGAADSMKLYVDDMRLERVVPENSRGFDLRDGAMAYSHSGYKTGARKQALVQNTEAADFCLLRATDGAVAYNGQGRKLPDGFVELDFTEFDQPGAYVIETEGRRSQPFPIGDDAYLATAWRLLNFFFSERCGFDQPGIHQECHKDVLMFHPDGRSMSVSGGWHDAADLTQGTGNSAECAIALLEMADAVAGRDSILYERLLEEARWGLNWVMRTRFGDGYRLGGLIIGIWTKNIRGDKDDMQATAGNNPYDNLKAASCCALAVKHFEDTDPVFARWCRNTAVEDFDFALERLEHSRNNSNEAELYALATVTAMRLYDMSGDSKYLDKAAELARTVMACQQTERRTDWAMPLRGFFYESQAKDRILAYYHQSQEQLFAQAMAMLLEAAPEHAEAPMWRQSAEAYADYLHDIADVMAPYGILPAAVYEIDNTDYSNLYHEGEAVGLPSLEEYNAQVRNGVRLTDSIYLRRFPVAYQFRGFHAVTMGKAKAALILGRTLADKRLTDIGTRQLEYILGYNPFAMSTVYGDGYDYPPLYGAYAGDVVGAVPVGIETFENDDEPYFPMQNNCTYKEIWTHTTARLLWCVAELFRL